MFPIIPRSGSLYFRKLMTHHTRYTPETQDVFGFEGVFLVDRNEEGLLQPMPIPEWKWDKLGMDFITGLPRTRSGYDSIWVVVDRLTKVAHFMPVKTTYTSAKLAKIYMTRIVCLRGVLRTIVSDRGT